MNQQTNSMNIELANTLFKEGTISELFKVGFINPKVFTYHEIYLWVHAQIKTRAISKNQAVLEAAVKFKRDERTVWRALNSFTSTDKEASAEQRN
jgi:hypothetical protein